MIPSDFYFWIVYHSKAIIARQKMWQGTHKTPLAFGSWTRWESDIHVTLNRSNTLPINNKGHPSRGGLVIGGGEGIRTLATLSCPTRFRVTPLRPAWVLLHITALLYQRRQEKSRLFRQLDHLRHLLLDSLIILPLVGAQTVGTILNTVFQICKVTAALVP